MPTAPGSRRDIVLLGPAAMGVHLDAEALYAGDYTATQATLAEYLNQAVSDGDTVWRFDSGGDEPMMFSPPGFHNRLPLPMAFISATSLSLAQRIQEAVASSGHDGWSVISASLDFFTFGIVAVRVDLSCGGLVLNPSAVLEAEASTHRLSSRLWPLCQPYVQRFEEAVCSVLHESLAGSLSWSRGHEGLFWLHRVLVFEVADLVESRELAQASVPNVYETLSFRDFLVVPAVDTSIICRNETSPESEDWLLRIFALEGAVGASLMQLDGWLFDSLNNVLLRSRSYGHAEAVKAVRRAQARFERVELHLAKVDSTVAFLGAASVAVWQARARVVGFPQLYEAIRGKLHLMERMSQARHANIQVQHSRRLNRLALVFTLFGAASAGVALIDFSQGGSWLSPDTSRLLVVIGLLLMVVGITFLAIREARIDLRE